MRCLYLRMDTFSDWKDYQYNDQVNDVSDDESDEKMQSYTITASAETELLTGMANQMSNWKAEKNGKSPAKKGCKHQGCGKPVFARGKCYRHDQEAKRASVNYASSEDEDEDDIYPVRVPMRTIGTQTEDLPLVSILQVIMQRLLRVIAVHPVTIRRKLVDCPKTTLLLMKIPVHSVIAARSQSSQWSQFVASSIIARNMPRIQTCHGLICGVS